LASWELGNLITTTRSGGSPSIISHCLARIMNLLPNLFWNGSRDLRSVFGVLISVLEIDLRDHVFNESKPYPFLDHVFGLDITDVTAPALYVFGSELQQRQIGHGYVGVFGQRHIVQETDKGA